MQDLKPTARTQVRRLPARANYDREIIYGILDEALICHLGFVTDGQPYVIPTIHVRVGDRLYVHGSPASRMLRIGKSGVELCITVTLLDGLVLARSAFHHSMNYRSAVVIGKATAVENVGEKIQVLQALIEHIVPGRWPDIRQPNEKELLGTLVLSMAIDEASAKLRSGGPIDDEDDYKLPIWAGVIPLKLRASVPIVDSRCDRGLRTPEYAIGYSRPSA